MVTKAQRILYPGAYLQLWGSAYPCMYMGINHNASTIRCYVVTWTYLGVPLYNFQSRSTLQNYRQVGTAPLSTYLWYLAGSRIKAYTVDPKPVSL